MGEERLGERDLRSDVQKGAEGNRVGAKEIEMRKHMREAVSAFEMFSVAFLPNNETSSYPTHYNQHLVLAKRSLSRLCVSPAGTR